MKEPKKGLDVILALGGGKPPSGATDEADTKDSSEIPPDFVAAFHDYEKEKTAENFWHAVKACQGSYDSNKD